MDELQYCNTSSWYNLYDIRAPASFCLNVDDNTGTIVETISTIEGTLQDKLNVGAMYLGGMAFSSILRKISSGVLSVSKESPSFNPPILPTPNTVSAFVR